MRLSPRHHAPLPASRLPRDLAPAISRALDAVNDRLRTAWAALPAAQRDARRADGGWSMREVLEHIALGNEQYLAPMTALADALATSSRIDVAWTPTFMGKWLVRSLEMTIPMPAPRRIQPGPSPRAEVLDAVIRTHEAIATLAQGVADTDWRSVRMVSPLNAMVRPNFGDAALVIVRHSERHTAQVEQLVRTFGQQRMAGH